MALKCMLLKNMALNNVISTTTLLGKS